MTPKTPTVEAKDLKEWQPTGTVIAIVGTQAAWYHALYQAALASIAAIKPDLLVYRYVCINTTAEELGEVLATLHAKKVWGIVFTHPLKSKACQLMCPSIAKHKEEELSELPSYGNVEATAERVGALSLAIWKPTGYWGLNTDGAVWEQAVKTELKLEIKGKTLVIVGTGALARAIAVQALMQGAHEVWIGGRTQENAWDALDQIVPSINMRARIHTYNLLKISNKVPKNAIIVNTIPENQRRSDTAQIDLTRWDKASSYFDCAISSSSLLLDSAMIGMKAANAAQMVAEQIAQQTKLLTGVKPETDLILWAVREASKSV